VPIAAELAAAAGKAGELLLAEAGVHRAWWHSREDVDSGLPALDLTTTSESVPGGYRLTVTANAFVRDLAVLADRLAPDATVDDMLVSLLPGESVVFAITTSAVLSHEQLIDPLVLRSANQLVAG
jgi:beta-mannosidase